MTRETYIRMTGKTRAVLACLPGGYALTRVPTLLCACAYMAALIHLMLAHDTRLIRVVLVPAACFTICTALRPVIGRQRPYDRFGAKPVGEYKPGKGKSMPSRHAASAAAIALAAAYAYPVAPVVVCMALLCAVVAFLRVACGQHYPGDVAAALALSGGISLIGYILI